MLKLTRVAFQLDVLEQDALEVLRLVRSWKNWMAPINRIPPEILSLVPDFLDMDHRDQDVITLTHVCRAWREVFVSRPSLWTNVDCVDLEQTRVYLERSKSSPINLSLDSDFFEAELIPSATGRLKSLYIDAFSEDLEFIGTHLSHPSPLLEVLSIRSYDDPVLPASLFNGNLSSLHELYLRSIRTELPWRNVANLTSFTFAYTSPPVSLAQLLDFFEGAPRLREVDIFSSIPIFGVRNGQPVPLPCLQRMDTSSHASSHLFDHLLIPVGARLTMGVDRLPRPAIGGRRPSFLDNLRNLPNFTTITFACGPACMGLSGPNGAITMVSRDHQDRPWLECLAHLDTSKTERLEIKYHEYQSSVPIYQALIPMKDLRTLKLDCSLGLDIFLGALDPSFSSSGAVACPRLEEIAIVAHSKFDLQHILRAAEARALGGMKLKAVTIAKPPAIVLPQFEILELKKHVMHVGFGVGC